LFPKILHFGWRIGGCASRQKSWCFRMELRMGQSRVSSQTQPRDLGGSPNNDNSIMLRKRLTGPRHDSEAQRSIAPFLIQVSRSGAETQCLPARRHHAKMLKGATLSAAYHRGTIDGIQEESRVCNDGTSQLMSPHCRILSNLVESASPIEISGQAQDFCSRTSNATL